MRDINGSSVSFRTWRSALFAFLAVCVGVGTSGAQVIDVGDAMLVEGDAGSTSMMFDVTLTGITPFQVTVDFATVDGSASTAAGDYDAAAGTLVFVGPGTQQVSVPIRGDQTVESDETFSVELSNAVNAGLGDASGTGTILNDDSAVLSIGNVSVLEGDSGTTPAEFGVQLSAPVATSFQISFATADETATAASGDYGAATGTLTILAGQVTGRLTVEVNGDEVAEGDETFRVNVSGALPAGVNFGNTVGIGTIVDDDQTPVLSIGDAAVFEGDSGTSEAILTVTLSGETAAAVTVGFSTRDGSGAAGSDYVGQTGELQFASGVSTQTIAITINGDATVEADEAFFVDLTDAVNAQLGDATGECTILNDDEAIESRLTVNDVQVLEGDSGTTSAAFVVRLSPASESPVSVNYATRDGSATVADNDYQPLSGTLEFPPGQSQRVVSVEVVGDSDVEADEDFFLDLSMPEGASLVDDQGRASIQNDDQEQSIIRFVELPSVVESAERSVVVVERIGGSSSAASVRVAATAGTATSGTDFVARSARLEWAAGEVGRRSFEFEIIDDSMVEGDETVAVSLSDAVDSVVSGPSEGTVTILDDDTPMSIAAIGEQETSAEPGALLEFEVAVLRADGSPVVGATVSWTFEGDAELLEGEETVSDAEGRARQRVQIGSSSGSVVVVATVSGVEGEARFEIMVVTDLSDMIDPVEDPGEASVAEALDDACVSADGSFGEMCDFVFELESDEQGEVIAELTPEEVAGQATIAVSGQRVQLGNIGARLAALRGGSTRVSVDQIAFDFRGEGIQIASLASAWDYFEPDSEKLDRALELAVGGAGAEPLYEDDKGVAGGNLGLFVNGRFSFGEKPTTGREAGFDFETMGATIGVDYRTGDRSVVGVALGYLDTGSDLSRDGGSLDATGYALSAYGSYFRESWWLDGILSFGHNEYRLIRHVDLPQPFQGQQRYVAHGRPNGDQFSLGASGGYDRNYGALSVGGSAHLTYTEADIDAYIESGAGPFDLQVGAQRIESLLSEAGIDLSYAASKSWGVLSPHVRISWLHELLDDLRVIEARFADDPSSALVQAPTDPPDRDFFNLSAGLTATLSQGRTLYLLYDTDLGRSDLDVSTITAGIRFEL